VTPWKLNKMPGNKYLVFKQMRPPVAIDQLGQSPLRTQSGKKTYSLGNGQYQDKNGYKITQEAIVNN